MAATQPLTACARAAGDGSPTLLAGEGRLPERGHVAREGRLNPDPRAPEAVGYRGHPRRPHVYASPGTSNTIVVFWRRLPALSRGGRSVKRPQPMRKDGPMSAEKKFTEEEARQTGQAIGINWDSAPFDVDQFRRGMDVELEHGSHDPTTDVTGDDAVTTGKIALAHLNEFADYYTRLERMEAEAEREADQE